MVSAWIVVDDSGSMTATNEKVRRIHEQLKDELECSFDVTSWMTGSSYGMNQGLMDRPLGAGGGDGTRHMIDAAIYNRSSRPACIVYLTDGHIAALDAQMVAAIANHNIVLVDVLDDRWNESEIFNTLVQLHDFLIHECDDDCCECNPAVGNCACNDGSCLVGVESGAQPFYPQWTSVIRPTTPITQRLVAQMFDEAQRQVAIEKVKVANTHYLSSFKHPVDVDLDNIHRSIEASAGQDIPTRAARGCELNGMLSKVLRGNTLTPIQRERIKAIRYRLYMVCFDFSHEVALKAIYGRNANTITTPNEVQEGQSMSAQITTTVSLKTRTHDRATVSDLKTLIAEVERVGGTDDSFVDFEAHRRTGCLDAAVVTAVEVTEPTLDPRVECVLSIQDEEKRAHALVDLLIDHPVLRAQITPHLIGDKTAKPAKKTAQAKAKA